MAQQVDGAAMPLDTEKVGIKGYLAFFLTIIFFSGVFSGSEGWWRVFDFTVLNGSFGHVTGTQTFRGAGGTGAKDGFLLRWSWRRRLSFLWVSSRLRMGLAVCGRHSN